ncbi:Asp-tRNA(Asn)/Glu-tRNA(Gln) amidotransferase subunit GatA [Gammaproteobacteria bacterium]|jgi:aspartyl-tRNA(Asn)/glutamyl-tRNA(Gln) amidotransferase subunit A|nr:Asp-tRNA(Asn)/Glu-tRNA(Gln) amidotransferase subunit GatA [SAR86 cluster bacterium]MDA9140792.1 Asp-tRNA(Asn)/Glu-tRNA(Gln) amidotransferase subunit GatA [Gammaproteobacteria bacterium]MBL6701550.1 Asp-tRNA(Asn)/Glu-tRNA(Gln) amidotransferase subunit GatA [SAR86 cluster bacterium]MDA9935988.1 Asp-tRNA(Asn)/Glu-tRNA(Gln) amidotransferase subunit GatA [Gammaproteobacteria bacterium]MDB2339475.1 Asp-tRNA(Asn)/Glu-tRNA(Gln) amidotransferase subunit GatA [Gammaproteobacteria bacterium]|tara:strand:+ start:201 stop:1658 length:1458 start_codon:yes stop_codon:yes gene_type:complete
MSIQFKSIADLREMLDDKSISASELIQESLELAKKYKELNCFVTMNEEFSVKKANAIDVNKKTSSRLSGIPLAQKDLFCTEGLRTTCSSKILSNFIPPYTATAVKKLEDAGSITIGKTNMDEFAMGSSNETSFFGNVHNPWKKGYVPGGSSGGSAAAVAAGIVPAATGTDTGGSIRQPAAHCGITGLKPTYGRISRWGMIAFASSLDQAGPLARTAEDCAILLNTMSGHDAKDTTSLNSNVPDFLENINQPIDGLKIGLIKEFNLSDLDSQVQARFEESKKAYEKLGAQFIEVSLPNISASVPTYYSIAPAECSSNLSRFDGVRFGHRAESTDDLNDLYIKSRSEGFGDEVKRRILIGTYALSAGYYDAYYKKAQQVRRLIKNDFDNAFQSVDALMTPTSPNTAFKFGSKGTQNPVELYLEDLFTISSNLAGLPAISIPHGQVNSLPVGLQLIGNFLREDQLLNAAHIFQKNSDYHLAKPNLGDF